MMLNRAMVAVCIAAAAGFRAISKGSRNAKASGAVIVTTLGPSGACPTGSSPMSFEECKASPVIGGQTFRFAFRGCKGHDHWPNQGCFAAGNFAVYSDCTGRDRSTEGHLGMCVFDAPMQASTLLGGQ